MANLGRDALKALIVEKQLVKGFKSLDEQLTANGFDARLAAVIEVVKGGRLAVRKEDNRAPKLGRAYVLPGFEGRLKGYDLESTTLLAESEPVTLECGKCYLVITCEEVQMPTDVMLDIGPRSSAFRYAQVSLEATFGEAGYKGFLTFLLRANLDAEIELGSRFAQLVFSQLTGHSHYEGQRELNYQGGKLI